MAIQELDVHILHRSGKHNSNADALSRVVPQGIVMTGEQESIETVAAVKPTSNQGLSTLQRRHRYY